MCEQWLSHHHRHFHGDKRDVHMQSCAIFEDKMMKGGKNQKQHNVSGFYNLFLPKIEGLIEFHFTHVNNTI